MLFKNFFILAHNHTNIFQSDFGEYSKDFGKLVEWMISNFTKLMRYVLFDISAYKAM